MDALAQAQNDLFTRIATRKQIVEAGLSAHQMRPRTEGESLAIINTINTVLAGTVSDSTRTGLAVLVPLPAFEVTRKNIPAVFGQIVFRVIVLENIMVNMSDAGTGLSCEAAAALIMLAGHHFEMADGRSVTCDGMTPLDVASQDFAADIAYEVTFRTDAGWKNEPECAKPTIVVDDYEVTVTCATSGAAIWLTTDGSMPSPSNPKAFLVTGPFEPVPIPTVYRAVAYHPDINPSSPAYKLA